MKIASHLRDFHGYTLSESVAYSPSRMAEIHTAEHEERDCGHPADHVGSVPQSNV